MKHTKATFTIMHDAGEVKSIAINMPFRKWVSTQGNQWIGLPLVCWESNLPEGSDMARVIADGILSDCGITERFGRGLETEMRAIGWKTVHKTDTELRMEQIVKPDETMLELTTHPARPFSIPSLQTHKTALA